MTGQASTFGAALASLAPGAAPISKAGVSAEIERVGAKLGFQSREVPVRRKIKQGLEEPTDQVNIRAAIADINDLVEFCEANRFTLGLGLRELLRRAGASSAT